MKYSPKKAQAIISQVADELDVDVCSLYIFDEFMQSLSLLATKGLDDSALGSVIKINQGLTGKVARENKPVAVKQPHKHPEFFHVKGSGEEQFESFLGIPLLVQSELLGVLVVQTTKSKMFFHSEIKSLYDAGRRVIAELLEQQSV